MAGLNSLLPTDLKKAQMEVYDESDKVIETINVLFNPSEYSISDSVEYASPKDKKGAVKNSTPQENFMGKNASVLNLSLFFDTNAVIAASSINNIKATDVSKVTKKFTALTRVKGDQHKPPKVRFVWGSLHFKGVVKDLKTSYTMFTESGMPVRAKMDLTIKMSAEKSDKFVEPFESPDRTKSRVVTEATSLWEIARKEYGDVGKWRIIADCNNLLNPLEIPSGTILKIPAI